MELKIVKNSSEFLELKDEWNTLFSKCDNLTYYDSFNYRYNWWKVFGDDKINQLRIICVYENNKVIGIAPLMLVNKKVSLIRYNALSFIGRADFNNFLVDKNSKTQSVLKKTFEAIHNFDKIDKLELSHVSQYSALTNFLLKSDIYNSKYKLIVENPIITFNSYQDFNVFKKRFFKKKINYYRNKLKKDHAAELEFFKGNEDSVLNKIALVHKERNNNSKDRRSLFDNERQFTFIKENYEESLDTLTFVLKNDDYLISYATCYVANNVVHNWNTSFNPKFKDYSAGDLIYFELINYLFENKETFKILDLGAGRYPWKFRMTDEFVSMYKLNFNFKTSKKNKVLTYYDKLFEIGKILLK